MKHFYSTNNADPMKCHTFHLGLHCLQKYTSPAGTSCVQRVYSKNTYIHIVLKVCRNLKFSLYSQLLYIDILQLKRKASKQINTNSTEPNVKSQLTTHRIPSTSSQINQIPLIGNTGTSSQTAGTSSQTAGVSSQTAGTSSQTAGTSSQTARTSSQTAQTSSQTAGTSSQTTASQTAGTYSQTARTSSQTAQTSSHTAGTFLKTLGTSSQTLLTVPDIPNSRR